MTKRNISIALVVLMVLSNIYMLWRVNSNTMSIASYDAGISQRTGVGRLESFWTKYIGGSKNEGMNYEDRERAEEDSGNVAIVLIVVDAVIAAALYLLNRKPKPVPVQSEEDDWQPQRRPRRRR